MTHKSFNKGVGDSRYTHTSLDKQLFSSDRRGEIETISQRLASGLAQFTPAVSADLLSEIPTKRRDYPPDPSIFSERSSSAVTQDSSSLSRVLSNVNMWCLMSRASRWRSPRGYRVIFIFIHAHIHINHPGLHDSSMNSCTPLKTSWLTGKTLEVMNFTDEY